MKITVRSRHSRHLVAMLAAVSFVGLVGISSPAYAGSTGTTTSSTTGPTTGSTTGSTTDMGQEVESAPLLEATVFRAKAAPAMDPDVYEAKVRYWINQRRSEYGLGRVRPEGCTDGVAERWSSFLARTLEFFHQDLANLIEGCNASYAGETLAKGALGPRHIVRLWMNSPAHRAIMLSSKPRRIGVGAYLDKRGAWVVAANFTRF